MTDIGREYATALFTLGIEENCAEKYYEALCTVKAAFDEAPEYVDFLASPGISAEERVAALEAAFSEILPENVLSFVQLLTEKGHARSFFDCMSEYKKLLDAALRVSVAKVTSAIALTEEQKASIAKRLEKFSGSKVTLECAVDEKLLGGIVVEIDGKVMDGSLRHRLGEVKEVISR